jgi:hypothetical protein
MRENFTQAVIYWELPGKWSDLSLGFLLILTLQGVGIGIAKEHFRNIRLTAATI